MPPVAMVPVVLHSFMAIHRVMMTIVRIVITVSPAIVAFFIPPFIVISITIFPILPVCLVVIPVITLLLRGIRITAAVIALVIGRLVPVLSVPVVLGHSRRTD